MDNQGIINNECNEPASAGKLLIFRRHPINLLFPALISLLMILMLLFFGITLSFLGLLPLPDSWPYIFLFSGVLLFLAISYFFTQWMFWYLDIWVVNEKKLVDSRLITFFLHRRSELALKQVQNISYNISGTLASLFRYGDITIQTAAKDGSFTLLSISNPGEAVAQISKLIEQASQVIGEVNDEDSHHIPHIPLGEILVNSGLITTSDVETALADQVYGSAHPIGAILIAKGLITKADLTSALSNQFQIPQVDLSRYHINPVAIQRLSADDAKLFDAIPISVSPDDDVLVALAQPSYEAMRALRSKISASAVDFVVADADLVHQAIYHWFGGIN